LEYHVTWSIDIDAESFGEAAQLALDIQRDTNSIASHFVIKDATGAIRELDTGLLRNAETASK
jgi:hypothetical protein